VIVVTMQVVLICCWETRLWKYFKRC